MGFGVSQFPWVIGYLAIGYFTSLHLLGAMIGLSVGGHRLFLVLIVTCAPQEQPNHNQIETSKLVE